MNRSAIFTQVDELFDELKKLREKLELTIQSTTRELSELSQEEIDLLEDIFSLNRSLDHKKVIIKKRYSDYLDLKTRVKEKKAEVNTLSDDLKIIESEIIEVDFQIKEAKKNAEDSINSEAILGQKIKESLDLKKVKTSELNTLKNSLNEIKLESVQVLEKKLCAIQKETHEITMESEKINEELLNLSAEKAEISRKLTEESEKRENAVNVISELKELLRNEKNTIGTLKVSVLELSKENENLERKKESINQEFKEFQEQYEILLTKKQFLQNTNNKIKRDLAPQESELEYRQKENILICEKINELNSEKLSLENKNLNLTIEVKNLTSQIEEGKNQIKRLSKNLEELGENKAKIGEIVSNLSNDLEKDQLEINELKRTENEYSSEIIRLEAKKQNQEAKLSELVVQKDAKAQDVRNAYKELQELTAQTKKDQDLIEAIIYELENAKSRKKQVLETVEALKKTALEVKAELKSKISEKDRLVEVLKFIEDEPIRKAQNEIQKLKNRLNDLEKEKSRLDVLICEKDDKHTELSEEIQAIRKVVCDKEKNISDLSFMANQQEAKIENLEVQITNLLSKNKIITEKINAYEVEIKEKESLLFDLVEQSWNLEEENAIKKIRLNRHKSKKESLDSEGQRVRERLRTQSLDR